MSGWILLLLFISVALFVYFLPTVVANSRSHPNLFSIFVLNLLLGWSFIGWVAAMVWACISVDNTSPGMADPAKPAPPATPSTGQLPTASAHKPCPFCAEQIKVEAIKCKHCGSMLAAATGPESADLGFAVNTARLE